MLGLLLSKDFSLHKITYLRKSQTAHNLLCEAYARVKSSSDVREQQKSCRERKHPAYKGYFNFSDRSKISASGCLPHPCLHTLKSVWRQKNPIDIFTSKKRNTIGRVKFGGKKQETQKKIKNVFFFFSNGLVLSLSCS